MSGNQISTMGRTLNIGKRERIYQGEIDMPKKMKFLEFFNAIYKNHPLKDDLIEREKDRELRRKCPIFTFNGELAFHNPAAKYDKCSISLNDILKHKNDYTFYDQHKLEILQIIPYNSDERFIRNCSKDIIRQCDRIYMDLIMSCLSFFGLQFIQQRDISIDDSRERNNMFQDRINHLFMKTLISSLYLYNENISVVLYSYYQERMADDDNFDFSKPFHLSLFTKNIEEEEDKEEIEEDIPASESKEENKEESKEEHKEQPVVKEEIKPPPPEQHYSIDFNGHAYDCVLSKNKHIYESNMVVYKVCSSASIIKRFQLIEGIPPDVLNDIQRFSSLTLDGICKSCLSFTFPKCLFFYTCDHEMNLRCTINEHVINDNFFPREIIIQYLYGLLIPICYMNSVQPPLIHKNINPNNVYFNRTNDINNKFIFHISGYIESRLCPNMMASRYVAPEVREGKEIYVNCDVYSVVIILLELLDGWISNGQVGFNEQKMAMIGDLKGIFDMMVYPNLQRPNATQILNMLQTYKLV